MIYLLQAILLGHSSERTSSSSFYRCYLFTSLEFIYSEKATIGQIYGGDFTKVCGILRIYEIKVILSHLAKTSKTEIIFNLQQHYVSKKMARPNDPRKDNNRSWKNYANGLSRWAAKPGFDKVLMKKLGNSLLIIDV